jgi:hypothetical protein
MSMTFTLIIAVRTSGDHWMAVTPILHTFLDTQDLPIGEGESAMGVSIRAMHVSCIVFFADGK